MKNKFNIYPNTKHFAFLAIRISNL